MTFLYRLFMLGQIVRHNLSPTGSTNGYHNLFGIQLKPKEACKHYAAVRFQEHVECAFNRMTFLAVYAPSAAVGFYLSGQPLAFVAAVIPAFAVRFFLPYSGSSERRGQSAESYVRAKHFGEDYDAVELANGKQLAHYSGFKGQSPERIAADLKPWRGWAAKMGKAFDRDIRGWL